MRSHIKALKRHTKFELEFPKHLFELEINKQTEFFRLLESLPSRLLYKLKKGSIKEVKHEDIKRLGYHIHEDSNEKIDIQEKITEDLPEELPTTLESISTKVRKSLTGELLRKLSQLSLLTLLWLLFVYFVFFKYMELEKNTIVTVASVVWWGLVTIIFRYKT